MFRNRKSNLCLAAILIAALSAIALGIAPAGANVEEQLESTRSQLSEAESRQGVLTTDIEALSGQINSIEGELSVLRNREAAVLAELEQRQDELDRATAALRAAVKELRELRHRLQVSLVELQERLVAIYRAGTPDMVTVLLSADGFDDLVQRAEYMSRIQSHDESIVNRVRDLRDGTRNLVEALAESRERIEAARDAVAAKQRELTRTRQTIEGQWSSLVATRGERQSMLDQVSAEMSELEKIEESLQRRIEQQIAAASSSTESSSSSGSSGIPAAPAGDPSAAGLIWPASGTFTSPFGYRWGRLHEGIDIALSEGTPLRAAASGSVILAAYTGGYGNYICIDHGGGLSTCYAHLSGYAVSVGSQVGQGDVIGYSGNTGSSTGPHLHFEVRINGVAQDPMGYL